MLCASLNAIAVEHYTANKLDVMQLDVDIYDPLALTVIDPNAKLVKKAEGFRWAEGPVWIEDGSYWLFSDIPNNRIMKYSDEFGLSTYLSPAGATGLHQSDSNQGSNGLLLSPDGDLVILQHGDRRIVKMSSPIHSPTTGFEVLASHYEGKRLNSPNDAVFHSNGTLYFTDPPYGLNGGINSEHKELDYQGVYMLAAVGTVTLLDKSLSYPNGVLLTQDESKLIVAISDRDAPKWVIFDITEDGAIKNKRNFFDPTTIDVGPESKGLPDGMKLHSTGLIFATGPGGVYLFNESGKLLARLFIDRATANLAFSSDEKTLFLTSHDVVYELALR